MTLVLTTQFQTPFLQDQWNHYLSQMPPFIKEEILRYRRWQDRQAVLLGKLLLLEGLKYYGWEPDSLFQLRKNEYGRPSILGFHDFSISHSANHILCAFQPHARIGADIEHIRPIDFNHFQNYMTHDEWQDIYRAEAPEKVFFRYWAMKESIIKADGRGLSAPWPVVDRERSIAFLQKDKWHVKEIDLFADMASCLACGQPLENVKRLSLAFD